MSSSSSTLVDFMKRDGKKLRMSNPGKALQTFLFSALILLPLWLFLLLPFAIVTILLELVWKKVTAGSKKSARSNGAKFTKISDAVPSKNREYDIVVFGATGFTGRLAALYLAKQYGNKVKWAIAGRRQAALEDIRKELVAIDSSLSQLPIIIADSSDLPSLIRLVQLTKVVLTTSGPFALYGTDLVNACAHYGTHYCDITGETDWVRQTIDAFDEKARETGARIVHFCGHDCVPWELTALACANELKKKGEQLKSIHFYDELNGSPSGGTFATILHSLANREKYVSQLGFDPLLKSLDKTKSTNKFTVNNTAVLKYSKEANAWVGPFVMAMVMSNSVRRSNALLNFGSSVEYEESEVYPNFFAGFTNYLGLLIFGTILASTPLRLLAQRTIIPAPGQGPSVKEMDAGFLRATAYTTGDKGGKVKATIYFPTDPGYRDTARMLVESGLALALDGHKLTGVGGGVFTPAACQGTVLLDRLVATGTEFRLE